MQILSGFFFFLLALMEKDLEKGIKDTDFSNLERTSVYKRGRNPFLQTICTDLMKEAHNNEQSQAEDPRHSTSNMALLSD